MLFYSDGSQMQIGDSVLLENGEHGKIYVVFLSAKMVGLFDPFSHEEDGAGVLVVTESGAEICYLQPTSADLVRAT